jgi:hypothetical protein
VLPSGQEKSGLWKDGKRVSWNKNQ